MTKPSVYMAKISDQPTTRCTDYFTSSTPTPYSAATEIGNFRLLFGQRGSGFIDILVTQPQKWCNNDGNRQTDDRNQTETSQGRQMLEGGEHSRPSLRPHIQAADSISERKKESLNPRRRVVPFPLRGGNQSSLLRVAPLLHPWLSSFDGGTIGFAQPVPGR